MSEYRRWYVPGGIGFFTLVTYGRRPLFAADKARQLLGNAIRMIRDELPFETIALVLLPDHLHAIWKLPSGDEDFSTRWKRIKREFTVDWLSSGGSEAETTPVQKRRGNRGVWQKRFYEHQIESEEDLEQTCDYIHYNPVKHGYVEAPADWPHSTYHRFVKSGQYELSWGRSHHEIELGFDCE
ncbi:MAG: REP-associated tyrosine transposase [Aeoliella sp.]